MQPGGGAEGKKKPGQYPGRDVVTRKSHSMLPPDTTLDKRGNEREKLPFAMTVQSPRNSVRGRVSMPSRAGVRGRFIYGLIDPGSSNTIFTMSPSRFAISMVWGKANPVPVVIIRIGDPITVLVRLVRQPAPCRHRNESLSCRQRPDTLWRPRPSLPGPRGVHHPAHSCPIP